MLKVAVLPGLHVVIQEKRVFVAHCEVRAEAQQSCITLRAGRLHRERSKAPEMVSLRDEVETERLDPLGRLS